MSSSLAVSCDEQRAHLAKLGDDIAITAAYIDATIHTLLTQIRAFDALDGWHHLGAISCAHYLSWRIGLNLGAAREKVRVAKCLGDLPVIDDALRLGEVSYSKVRAMTRVATPENERELLAMAQGCPAAQLEKICRLYRSILPQTAEAARVDADRRWVRTRDTDDGMVRIEAQLRPDEAAVVMKAIEASRLTENRLTENRPTENRLTENRLAENRPAENRPAENRPTENRLTENRPTENRPTENRLTESRLTENRLTENRLTENRLTGNRAAVTSRVDALVALAEAAVRGNKPERSATEVIVHVDAQTMTGHLETGHGVSAETCRRLCCDAGLVPVLDDETGRTLDVGRKTRSIPAALRRALQNRDGGCRFPGCTHRIADAHHILHWADGGETSLQNTVLLCRRHHGFVHEYGFTITRDGDGELSVRDPGGEPIPPTGPRPLALYNADTCLRRAIAERGIVIDEDTSLPNWDGRPPDFGVAVEVLARLDHLLAPAGGSEGQ